MNYCLLCFSLSNKYLCRWVIICDIVVIHHLIIIIFFLMLCVIFHEKICENCMHKTDGSRRQMKCGYKLRVFVSFLGKIVLRSINTHTQMGTHISSSLLFLLHKKWHSVSTIKIMLECQQNCIIWDQFDNKLFHQEIRFSNLCFSFVA